MSLKELYLETARGKISYIYGKEAARKIFSDSSKLRVTLSGTGRVRHLYLDDELLFTLRMEDGYLLPTLRGAELISYSVVVSEDAAPFVRRGKSVMAKSVIDLSPDLIPGVEVAVKTKQGEIIAVGRLLLSPEEILSVKRGVAVKVRDAVSRERSEESLSEH